MHSASQRSERDETSSERGAGLLADRQHDGYSYNYRDRDYRYRRHSDNGAAIVFGLGVLTLAAVLASQHHDHDGWYGREGGYYRDYDGYYRGY
jgi:hypothetical protein